MKLIFSLTVCLLFIAYVACQKCNGDFTLPKFYSNDMVFQSAPNKPDIWGFTKNPLCIVRIIQTCSNDEEENDFSSEIIKESDKSIWRVNIKGYDNGIKCMLNITQGEKTQTLNIIFGDVYICSGQSNMERRMNQIFKPPKIASFSAYTNIKMFLVNHAISITPREDLKSGWDKWYAPNDIEKLSAFSAVCFLYAKELTDVMGPDYIFGLIASTWGGTRIETWSSPDALKSCNVSRNIEKRRPELSNSYLWNAMIHPLLKHTIFGALWYQGEENKKYAKNFYNCTFPAMIADWRAKWSNIDPVFPFGFVQLANNIGHGVESIRWHQTNDIGFVPNPKGMSKTFMAVSMDTYDKEQGIHPRKKLIVAKRLKTAGLNVAYGMTQYPTSGPFPQSMSLSTSTANIIYDQPFTYNSQEISGFYYCSILYNNCDSKVGLWRKIEPSRVTFIKNENRIKIDLEKLNPTGLAYLWEDTPTKTNFGLPIYADDEYYLPAAPWKVQVESSLSVKLQIQYSYDLNQKLYKLFSLLLPLLVLLLLNKRFKNMFSTFFAFQIKLCIK